MHQKLNFLNLYTLTVQLVQPPQHLLLSYLAPPSTSLGAFSVRCHIEYIHSSKLQEFGGMKPTQPRVLRNGMSPTFGANHGAGGETL